MEQKEFDRMLEVWLCQQKSKHTGKKEGIDWAIKAGITDGSAPLAFVTREEMVQMLYRALEYFFRQIVGMLYTEENKKQKENPNAGDDGSDWADRLKSPRT